MNECISGSSSAWLTGDHLFARCPTPIRPSKGCKLLWMDWWIFSLVPPSKLWLSKQTFFSFRFLINVYSVFRKLSNLPHEGNSVSALRFFLVVEPLGACERKPHSGNQQEPVFSLMYGVYSISLRSICRL